MQQQLTKEFCLGIDIGGTSTDSVYYDLKNNKIISHSEKEASLTTKGKIEGVLNSIQSLLNTSQIQSKKQEYIQNTNSIIIGTTHLINSLIQEGIQGSEEQLSRVSVIRLSGPLSEDFPAFNYKINNTQLVNRIKGPCFIVDGGYSFGGRYEYSSVKKEQIWKALDEITALGIRNIAISSVFSFYCNKHEVLAKQIIEEYQKEKNLPNFSISCSHEISQELGLLERENATILNECMKYIAFTTFSKLSQIYQLGFSCPIFISKSEGGIMHIKEACEYPIRCFSASVINSLKGGKFISKEQNGFVLDIGGTSTDIAILQNSSARQNQKFVEEFGVQLNFKKCFTDSIALGGGSQVLVLKDKNTGKISVEILGTSISFQTTVLGVCFGGNVLTNTDFAIYNKQMIIPNSDRQKFVAFFQQQGYNEKEIEEIVNTHKFILCQKILDKITPLISSDDKESIEKKNERVKLILVGGGAQLLDLEYLQSLTKIFEVKPLNENFDVANAIGATQPEIHQKYQKDFDHLPSNQEQLDLIEEQLVEFKRNGAIINDNDYTVKNLHDKETINLPYINNTYEFKFILKAPLDLKHFLQQKTNQQLNQLDIPSPNACKYLQNVEYTTKKLFEGPKIEDLQQTLLKINNLNAFKPVLIIDSYEKFEQLAWGCSIFGSGGGGPITFTLQNAKKEDFKKRPLLIYDPESMTENQFVASLQSFGTPYTAPEQTICKNAFIKTLMTINERCYKNSIFGIYGGELGGQNGITPLLVSYQIGFPFFDLIKLPRAFPEFQQCLPCIRGQKGLPASYVNSNGKGFIIHPDGSIETVGYQKQYPKIDTNNFKEIEKFIRSELVITLGFRAVEGGFAFQKQEFKKYLCQNCYQYTHKLGEVLYNLIRVKQLPVDKAIQLVPQVINAENDEKNQRGIYDIIKTVRALGKGIMVNRVSSQSAYSIGYLYIKLLEPVELKDQVFEISIKNEYLIMKNEKIVLAQSPDLITLLDSQDGSAISSNEYHYGREVIIITMKVDKELYTEESQKFIGIDVLLQK